MKKPSISRSAIFIAGLVLVAAGSYSVYSLMFGGSPKIEIIPAYKDLGDVTKEGFNYTFTVKNSGSKLLVIDRVSTSCGCTQAKIDKERLDTGEQTELHVTFNPQLMEEEVKGKVSRIIFIDSNDPENPSSEVKLTANVVDR